MISQQAYAATSDNFLPESQGNYISLRLPLAQARYRVRLARIGGHNSTSWFVWTISPLTNEPILTGAEIMEVVPANGAVNHAQPVSASETNYSTILMNCPASTVAPTSTPAALIRHITAASMATMVPLARGTSWTMWMRVSLIPCRKIG